MSDPKGWFFIETDLDELDERLGFTGPLLLEEMAPLLARHAEFRRFLEMQGD